MVDVVAASHLVADCCCSHAHQKGYHVLIQSVSAGVSQCWRFSDLK